MESNSRQLRKANVLSPMSSMKPTASMSNGSAAGSGCEGMTATLAHELMNAATSFHKLHLKVTGPGSYAAHKALNDLYDALPGHADDLAEGYQGAAEKLLSYPETLPKTLNSVEDALSYIRELVAHVGNLQAQMPYSELVNELDNVKSTLNSAKYKLKFLS